MNLRIYQVVPYYPPHIGGMEFYVQRLSEELVKQGHDVTVFTSSNTGSQTIEEINGVKVVSLKISTKIYNIPIVPTLFSQLMSAERPDVIHTHQYPIFFSDVSAIVCKLRNIPLVIHVHVVSDAKSAFSGLISNAYYSTMGLMTLAAAKKVIVPSLAYKQIMSGMHVDSNQLEVIHYGIDLNKFNSSDGTDFRERYGCKNYKIILSVGRLNYQKGFHYLIQAMPTILKQIPSAKLVIVGDGEQLAYLQQLTEKLCVSKAVIFSGALNQAEIVEAYAAADLFVLPSLFESFGISLIEAQAAGKPVIASRTGGTPEALMENRTGLLVEPANHQLLGQAIVLILKDVRLSKKMGLLGKKFVNDKYEIHNTIENIVWIYNSLT